MHQPAILFSVDYLSLKHFHSHHYNLMEKKSATNLRCVLSQSILFLYLSMQFNAYMLLYFPFLPYVSTCSGEDKVPASPAQHEHILSKFLSSVPTVNEKCLFYVEHFP